METLSRLYRALEDDFSEHLETCRNFLRQKSISATGEGLRETALILKDFIEELGGSVRLEGVSEAPIVYGRLDRCSPQTLIIYGMYDVMPAEEPQWKTPPFSAEITELPKLGDCIIARGAVNSKGALCGVFNTLRTMHRNGGIPLNLIFTIEGEEEIGSLHFSDFIQNNRRELHADGAVDFDFSQDSSGKAVMHLGLKGIVYMDLVCRGGRRGGPMDSSMHGSVSAWISSPVWRLVHALSTLTDENECILIPGFYDNVIDPGADDLSLIEKLEKTFDEKAFLKEMRSSRFRSNLKGVELLKRCLYSPFININGIHAGYTGSGTKTVLPRKAIAKIDTRFGPNMEPEEVVAKLKKHLAAQGFGDIEVSVRDSYTWSKTEYSETIVQHMVGAYREFDREPEI